MLPYLRDLPLTSIAVEDTLIYGRPADDFLAECLLFRAAAHNSMVAVDVQRLRHAGFSVCYSYEMLDLGNREFTEQGYQAIVTDLRRASNWGYSHVQLCNPYLIDLVANEFQNELKIVVSSQLEFNSGRARVFLDVMNNPSSITHVVISQKRLTPASFSEMQQAFAGIQLVVELDRWLSDVQIVHERFYNILYGHDSSSARRELRRLATSRDILTELIPTKAFVLEQPKIMYKLGEINCTAASVLANVTHFVGASTNILGM